MNGILSSIPRVTPGQAADEVFTANRINAIQDILKKLISGDHIKGGAGISVRPSSSGPSISREVLTDAQREHPEQTFILAPYALGYDEGTKIAKPSDVIKTPEMIDSLGEFEESDRDEDLELAQAEENFEARDPTNLTSQLREFTIHGPRIARISYERDFIEFLMPGQYEITIETESEIIPEGADDALIMKWPVLGGANQSVPWYPDNPLSADGCQDGDKENELNPWYSGPSCNGYIVEDAVIFESPSGAGSSELPQVWKFYGVTITDNKDTPDEPSDDETHAGIRLSKDSLLIDYAGSYDGSPVPIDYYLDGFEKKLSDDWWYMSLPHSEYPAGDYYILLRPKYDTRDPMKLDKIGDMDNWVRDADDPSKWVKGGTVPYYAEIEVHPVDELPDIEYSGTDENITIIRHNILVGVLTQYERKQILDEDDNVIGYAPVAPHINSPYAGSPITLWPIAIEGVPTSHPMI